MVKEFLTVMRKILKNISFIITFFILLTTNIFSAENKILLKVNNEIITTVDILNEIKFLSIMSENFSQIDKNKKIEIAKNLLIQEKIKLIEIYKFKEELYLEESVFENIVKQYFNKFGIKNLDEFNIFLNKNNLNPNAIEEKINIDTYWKSLIYEKFSKNIKINRDEIEKNIEKKKKQKEYLLSEIFFSLDNNEKLDAKFNLINKKIKETSFSEAALNYSISDSSKNGGKLGWIKEEVLSNNIKKKISDTDIGKFTNPIVIPGGFLILKIDEIRTTDKEINSQKEIENIINMKTNQQLERFSNIYLKKLKENIQLNEV